MPRKFVDTSALVKLFLAEADTPVVRMHVAPTDEIVISALTHLEFRSAFYGRIRQGTLTPADVQVALQAFQASQGFYRTLPIDATILQLATQLLDRYTVSHGLRPSDAIQLGTALAEHARAPLDAFVTTDSALAATAAAAGLIVVP